MTAERNVTRPRPGTPASRGDLRDSLRPTSRVMGAPLWSQVKASLTRLIVEQGLGEHARLPSESELCDLFGVSRTVVREAMSQMVNEGLIYKLQGKGAFIAGRREEQDFVGSTVGFSGELADKRKEVSRRILRQTIGPATTRIAKMMRIPFETPLVYVDRVMSVDGSPRMIVRWAMLESVVPALDTMQLENRSLYDTIARQYGVKLMRAERWIEAVSASEEDAGLLGLKPGAPILEIESVASNPSGQIIEYYTAQYLTDRSRLHFIVTAPKI